MSDETGNPRADRDSLLAAGAETNRRTVTGKRRGLKHRRLLRWSIVLTLTAVAGTIAAITAAPGGATLGLSDVVSQVQNSFGDGRILSASVDGTTLNVKLAAPDEPSVSSATFEADVLAHAVRDLGVAQITSVNYLDAGGAQLAYSPQGGNPVPAAAGSAPLGSGACASAAQAAEATDASLTTVSAKTIPYAGGGCTFEFQSSDPTSFASNAPITIGKIVNTMGDPNERPYLVQVDDQSGTPQFVSIFDPGEGGQVYIKPGLSTAFAAGGSPIPSPSG